MGRWMLSPVLGSFWFLVTENPTKVGLTCRGLYYLRQHETGQFQACGFSHSCWVAIFLAFTLSFQDRCGLQVFVVHSKEGRGWFLPVLCGMHADLPRSPQHTWLFKFPAEILTPARGQLAKGLELLQLAWTSRDPPWACSIQQGTESVISESFLLLYYMCLIIHHVFSRHSFAW